MPKLQRSANTRVLGILLLNSTAPDRPGRNKVGDSGRSITAVINVAKLPALGHMRGQNGADCHSGKIKVPCALQAWACLITQGINPIGGHNQLFSFDQSTECIHSFATWVPPSAIKSFQLCIVEIGKSINAVWAPYLVNLKENLWVNIPIITINYAAKVVCPLIEFPWDPLRLNTDIVLYGQSKYLQGNAMEYGLAAAHLHYAGNILVISKPTIT